MYARYGTEEIPTDIDDPLEVFDATDVSTNVMPSVIYTSWSKRKPDSFEKYLLVRERRLDLWRDYIYKLWRLYREKRSSTGIVLARYRDPLKPGSLKI